jgi:hypothetical protein
MTELTHAVLGSEILQMVVVSHLMNCLDEPPY